MRRVRLAAGALNQIPLDWKGNLLRIQEAIQAAKKEGAHILCLPELCVSGYGCEDHFHAPFVHEHSLEVLQKALPFTDDISLCLGLPIFHRGRTYNAICFIANQKILGFVPKQFLAVNGVHYESRWFTPWPPGVIETFQQTCPIGDILFDLGGVRVGFEICRDAWVGPRSGIDLSRRGADIILNPSASHFSFGKHEVRERYILEGSRSLGVSYVYSNLLGCESGSTIFEGDCMIAASGEWVAKGQRFSLQDVIVTVGEVDIDCERVWQSWKTEVPPEYNAQDLEVVVPFLWMEKNKGKAKKTEKIQERVTSAVLPSVPSREEEFSYAITLALLDYLRKSRSRGCVVNLSGGADSSATAVLVALMVHRAWQELGKEGVFLKFPYLSGKHFSTEGEMVESFLTCIYQKTDQSSEETYQAACALASDLHANFYFFDIQGVLNQYVKLAEGSLQRSLTWERDDLVLQNVQARTRVPLAWMVANEKGALLLTTGNRSESSVGYMTMDGDSAGGLNLVGGVSKSFLQRWLSTVEREGTLGLPPIPSLKYSNSLVPSAELRPKEFAQSDEKDLMPYEILNAIEEKSIVRKQSPLDTYRDMLSEWTPRFSEEMLGEWVKKFFLLWGQSQWKRERMAPAFHVDDYNVSPRSWCRFPILSSGFEGELAELSDFLGKKR